jgi:hypothetical protein
VICIENRFETVRLREANESYLTFGSPSSHTAAKVLEIIGIRNTTSGRAKEMA